MADDRWLSCDLPVLEGVAVLEERDDRHFGLHELAKETGFDLGVVKRSLGRLEGQYLAFAAMPGDDDPLLSVRDVRLLPAGRRATRQWPSPEDAFAGLIDALDEAAGR